MERWGVALALTGVVLVGAALRFQGQLWDGGTLLHPDERAITLVAHDRIGLPPAAQWSRLLNPALSPLNPRRVGQAYHYGTLPLYLATAGAALHSGGRVSVTSTWRWRGVTWRRWPTC